MKIAFGVPLLLPLGSLQEEPKKKVGGLQARLADTPIEVRSQKAQVRKEIGIFRPLTPRLAEATFERQDIAVLQ